MFMSLPQIYVLLPYWKFIAIFFYRFFLPWVLKEVQFFPRLVSYAQNHWVLDPRPYPPSILVGGESPIWARVYWQYVLSRLLLLLQDLNFIPGTGVPGNQMLGDRNDEVDFIEALSCSFRELNAVYMQDKNMVIQGHLYIGRNRVQPF